LIKTANSDESGPSYG